MSSYLNGYERTEQNLQFMVASRLTLTKKAFAIFLFFAVSFSLTAQDIHYSQFKNASTLLSPALTGVFDGKTRLAANYRAQWYTVPVSYRTVLGAFDTKLYSSDHKTSFWGLGAVLSYDRAGDSRMGTTAIGLNGSYSHQLTKANFITLGVQLQGTQRSFHTDRLRFDEQYDGENFNPLLSNNEDFSDRSAIYGDFSAGFNWNYNKPNSRSKVNTGMGWFHINRPNASFWDEADIHLCQRFNAYVLSQFQLTNKFDLLLHGLGRGQGTTREYLIGTAGRIHVNQTPTKKLAIDLGLAYRWNTYGFTTGDALIPNIEFNFKDWLFGISYDINLTQFKTASSGFGGPEFAVQYIFRPAPTIEFCPTCPVYMQP